MLVQCPKCKTTYKVADELLKGAAPTFRCSRCKHTFDLDWQEPIRPLLHRDLTARQFQPEKQDDLELSFSFSPRDKITTNRPPGPHDPAKGDSRSKSEPSSAERWSMNGEAPTRDEPFTISEAREPLGETTGGVSSQNSTADDLVTPPIATQPVSGSNIVAFQTYRDQQVSTLPFLTGLALLLVFYSLLTAFQQVNPAASESWLKKIPLFGATILKNNHLKNGVLLHSLRAGYQSLQGNREVFIVTGIAQNQNSVVIREVRIAGQVFNQEGKELEQQTIWLGNAISPKIVRGMTAQDISNLQRLKSLKRFEVPPGDSVPFTIVFLKPPRGIKGFSCGIVSAEGSV